MIIFFVKNSTRPGQVEGGFVQGLGLFTLEEPLFSPANGQVITRGPSNYKIPSADDIPEEFNVSLLRGCPNPHAVYSSKVIFSFFYPIFTIDYTSYSMVWQAVGEPPLFLASSVFFAIKDAIYSARTESGLTGNFTINSPATAERIRMACEDHLIQKVNNLFFFTLFCFAGRVTSFIMFCFILFYII